MSSMSFSSGVEIMIRLLVNLLLASLLSASAIGYAVEWGDRAEGELRWGEALATGGYSLMAADFTPEEVTPRMVMLKLSRGEDLIATRALGSGDSFSVDDDVMVIVQEVWMRDRLVDGLAEPRARVVLLVSAVPELRVVVVSEDYSFEAGEVVNLRVEIENVGLAEAEDLVVEVTTDPPIFSSRYRRSSLAPGELWDEDPDTREVEPIKIRFATPSMAGPEEVSVKVQARYLDGDGSVYESWGGTSFRIYGPLRINKYADEAMKLKDKSLVRVSVSNRGDRPLVVDISDSVGREFRADSVLNWKATIPPGGMETRSYAITARKPGEGQILPPAEGTYTLDGRTYRVASRSPVIDVIGPLVEVEKKASATAVQKGEEVTVTLTATNVGNRRTIVSAKATAPVWGSIASGQTDLSRVLLPGETAALIYSISCPVAGRFDIPPTSVCYRDEDGTACTIESSGLSITIEDDGNGSIAASTGGSGPRAGDSPSPAEEEKGGRPARDRGDGVGAGEDADAAEGSVPGGGSMLWALPILIIMIFIAFERYI